VWRYCYLSSFRLQPTSGTIQATFPGWEPRHSLGFFPFSAIIITTWRTKLPNSPLLARRFSQPHGKSNADNNLQVYSTLQALPGFGLQSLTSKSIVYRFRLPTPAPLLTFHGFLPEPGYIPACNTTEVSLIAINQIPTPCPLKGWLPS